MRPKDQAAGNARPTFYEVVLEGNPERTHGLLTGLLLGSGADGKLYFSHEAGVARDSLGERIARVVGLHAAISHVLVDKPMHDLLSRYAKRIAAGSGVHISQKKRVKAAAFAFSYHAYARKYGLEIQKLLDALPTGLRIADGKPTEKIDESARGVEAYSPAHHYEISAKGTVSGRLDLLIEARAKLGDHPLVVVEPIELELA